MKIDYTHESGVTIVPEGLFDYSVGNDCIHQVEQYVKEFGAVQVTFDFCNTTYMDSSGIGALIVVLRKLPMGAPPIKLIRLSRSIHKLMEVCHLHKLFRIEP